MLLKANRRDAHAYTVGEREADPSLISDGIEEGQWVTYGVDGRIIKSDGTKKSFMAYSSLRAGRNNITSNSINRLTFVMGAHAQTIQNNGSEDTAFDSTKVYAPMTPLKVVAGGILAPATGVAGEIIEAYAEGPVFDNKLRIIIC